MSLELARYRVSNVTWGAKSSWSGGHLILSRDDLTQLVLDDPTFSEVTFELVRPGDGARVNRVLDVLEPRAKTIGEGTTFPGIGTDDLRCGSGTTSALSGLAIVNSATFERAGANMLGSQQDCIIDMSPPGSLWSPFSATVNLVVTYEQAESGDDEALDVAIRHAGITLARHLAALTRDSDPDHVDTYLGASERAGLGSATMPIAYVCFLMAIGPLIDAYLYGTSAADLHPRWIDQAELIDGALVDGNCHYGSHRVPTYLYQNNPVLEALHRRSHDGVDIAGVILANKKHSEDEKREGTAEIMKLLGQRAVAGVCTHPALSGNAQLDAMYLAQACERAQIPAGLMLLELAGAAGDDFGLVDFVAEEDLIVTVGNRDEPIALPSVPEVFGSSSKLLTDGRSVAEGIEVDTRLMCAATSQVGALPATTIEV